MKDQPRPNKSPEGPRLRLLVIDDDALLLEVFRKLLRGHAATLVASGDEGLALVRAGELFDAILCDMQMPRMGGEAFLEALRLEWPEMANRVVFMSGGAGSPSDEAFLEEHPALMKPFRLRDLERMLALVIANSGDGTEAPGSRPPESWSSRGA